MAPSVVVEPVPLPASAGKLETGPTATVTEISPKDSTLTSPAPKPQTTQEGEWIYKTFTMPDGTVKRLKKRAGPPKASPVTTPTGTAAAAPLKPAAPPAK